MEKCCGRVDSVKNLLSQCNIDDGVLLLAAISQLEKVTNKTKYAIPQSAINKDLIKWLCDGALKYTDAP